LALKIGGLLPEAAFRCKKENRSNFHNQKTNNKDQGPEKI